MSIESPADLEAMRLVAQVTRETLDALAARVTPGITTAELDAVAAGIFAKHGARSAPAMVYGFPGHVLISINDEIVHGIPGPRALKRGDLVKLDVTVEKDGYIADAARSMVVEAGSRTARKLVACAEAAFHAAIAVARAGTRVNQIGRAIEREVRRHGFAVVHGLSGHGVGRTIHEEPSVPNEGRRGRGLPLRPGLVLAIEPWFMAGGRDGYRIDDDGWTLRSADGSRAAHFEHTVAITADGPLILTLP